MQDDLNIGNSVTTSNVNARFDKALKTPDITDRIEEFLSVKDQTTSLLSKIAANEKTALKITFWSTVGLTLLGWFAMPGSLILEDIVYSSVCTMVGGIGISANIKGYFARKRALNEDLVNKIDNEVTKLLHEHPQETHKSPRFLKALKGDFNTPSSRAMPTPPPKPAMPTKWRHMWKFGR